MATSCIPIAEGVFGNSTPPNWLSGTPAPFNGSPDDPRWVGSLTHSFGDGAGVQLLFRALTNPARTNLLLSWLVKVDPLVTAAQDSVFVGFGSSTAAVLVQIKVATTSPTEFGTSPGAYSPQIFVYTGGNWSEPMAAPTWVTTGTRVWVNYGSPNPTPWAVQMVVPIGAGQFLDPSNSIALQSGANFKMWYSAVLNAPVVEIGADIQYPWPGTAPIVNSFPEPSTWQEARVPTVANDPLCTGTGISLGYLDIGTKNIDGSPRASSGTIQFDKDGMDATQPNHSNMFFAHPNFPPGTPLTRKQAVRARFRMANWGSQIGQLTAQSWRNIPGGDDVPCDTNQNGGECHFLWPTQSDLLTLETKNILNLFRDLTTTRDQCMLVELSSAFNGEVFLTNSIRRNMDLVRASKFSRNAEISIVGLTPFSAVPRDVYLYLETINMPARLDDGRVDSPPVDQPRVKKLNEVLAHLSAPERRGLTHGESEDTGQMPDIDQIARHMPTYRVHVYHDTGLRTTLLGGGSRRILSPQSSFGFFVEHEGDLIGWAARLHGAIRIEETFYLIRVPNNGVAKVKTVIQAIEDPNEPLEPEDPIVPMPPPLTEPCAVSGSERFFIGFFSHGGVASVKNFSDRFVSPVDNYAYRQSEITYEYYLHSTRPPAKGFVQGQQTPPAPADANSGPGDLFQLLWGINDSTGQVSLRTSYHLSLLPVVPPILPPVLPPEKETPTNDGCVKVYAVCQRRARVYYVGAPYMHQNVVRKIQQALTKSGNPCPIDGIFGVRTEAAVVAFQVAHRLDADGKVGPKTAKVLGVEL